MRRRIAAEKFRDETRGRGIEEMRWELIRGDGCRMRRDGPNAAGAQIDAEKEPAVGCSS